MLLDEEGQFKFNEASKRLHLTKVFTDYTALDGIFWQPKYNPTLLLSCLKATSRSLLQTFVNAFGFDLSSSVGIGFLVLCFSPFFLCSTYTYLSVSSCYCLLLTSSICQFSAVRQPTHKRYHLGKKIQCLLIIKVKCKANLKQPWQMCYYHLSLLFHSHCRKCRRCEHAVFILRISSDQTLLAVSRTTVSEVCLTLVTVCCLAEHVYSRIAARHPADQLVHLVCPFRWIPCAMLSVRRQDTMMLLAEIRCTVHMA